MYFPAKYFLIAAAMLTAAFTFSCSSGNKFKIDGHLLNMDQGEILVYSDTRLIAGLDTIHIVGGRFSYERRLENNGNLVLVFPNFSEIPIFAIPGENVTIKGNAHELSSMSVTGTKDNELYTRFRSETKDLTLPKALKKAEEFIGKNLESAVSVWLLEKYFLKTEKADYNKAFTLAKKIKEKQGNNAHLAQLLLSLEKIGKNKDNGKLPDFSAKDIFGNTVDNKTLKGKKSLIYTYASWDYSNQTDYKAKQLLSDDKKVNIVKIYLDPYREKIKKENKGSEKKEILICDEKMFNSTLLKKLTLNAVGNNIIVSEDGKILQRNASPSDIEKLIK